MPAYICPSCKKEVVDVKVYHHEPDEVTCPYCKTRFKTDGSGGYRGYGQQ